MQNRRQGENPRRREALGEVFARSAAKGPQYAKLGRRDFEAAVARAGVEFFPDGGTVYARSAFVAKDMDSAKALVADSRPGTGRLLCRAKSWVAFECEPDMKKCRVGAVRGEDGRIEIAFEGGSGAVYGAVGSRKKAVEAVSELALGDETEPWPELRPARPKGA